MPALLHNLASSRTRPCLRVASDSLTYHELDLAARAHGARLLQAGLSPGDRVALWATPDAATAIAFVGNALAGLVSVPLNPALGSRELAHLCTDAAPRAIFASDPARFRERTPQVEALLQGEPTPNISPPDDPDHPLLVLYTSGTTGPPKGAILTHGNAVSNLAALADAWGWTEEDVLVHALPIFHVHGLVLGLFGSLFAGSSLTLLPRFSPELICAAFGANNATMLFAVPTMYGRLASHLAQHPDAAAQLARARLLVSGSAGLPARDHHRIEQLTGQRLVERYGLTETLINCAARHDGERRAGSVGPPLPGVELHLVDDERRVLESPSETSIGEIAVRGPNVFAGYLNRPDATAAVLDASGRFFTGDLATRGRDGSIRIVGRRATDLIKTGGFKVGAGEVEAALLEHPAVREAAVVGAPDDDLGERIVAYVVLGDELTASQALIDFVASTLAPHKRPRELHLVDALPRNAMGKVLKRELLRS